MVEKLPLSIAILTLNEEARLPACLASVADCDDVVVIDSGSTDRTVDVARAAGARVLVNRFENFAQQRNHAHDAAGFRHPWVFHLDADEQMTPELLAECTGVARADPPLDACFAAPHMMFRGVWLRRCTDHPAWQARFVRRDGFRFVQSGHGQREAPGSRMGFLAAGYRHDITPESPAAWEEKHRRYARQEAAELFRTPVATSLLLRKILTHRGVERRRALKRLSYSWPFRPFLRFVYQYLLRGGFRDGRNAWQYCRLLARYEGFATAEARKLRAPRHA